MLIQNPKVKRILNLWLPTIIWGLVIFFFSAFPTEKTSEIFWQDFILKKLAHIVEYGIFAILIYRSYKESGIEKSKAGIYAVLSALIYGVSDEFHQSFTPGREPAFRDVIFDTIGAFLSIYSLRNFLPKAPEKLKNLANRFQLT